eukprot:CAMPEP_0170567180 /NCGR_PEP_ID=MMETSP0211-20121228/80316_1 /TAXON_ID=311385 /ORGANISM="Pseudokeronopsis sp., Strain OXSARD2" /LENGTH=88 /DNA_ID=CAMNT_0010888567 /DNA_START=1073 /DNA_END=1339 /DNA_ORIENTATION=+
MSVINEIGGNNKAGVKTYRNLNIKDSQLYSGFCKDDELTIKMMSQKYGKKVTSQSNDDSEMIDSEINKLEDINKEIEEGDDTMQDEPQ